MDDLLRQLDSGACVLDLGCGHGSFSYEDCGARVLALDHYVADPLQSQRHIATGRIHYLLGRAERLPLAPATADLVISNHIFEHVERPQQVAAEISRVLKPTGILFASVPDGFGFSDGLYRWWTGGGGHVQRFTFRGFQETVESGTDLTLLYGYRLYTSFSFLNPNPAAVDFPPRSQWLGHLPHFAHVGVLSGINLATRAADALLGGRFSQYGWAFYFGKPAALLRAVHREENINVCFHCGAGHSLGWMEQMRKVRRYFGLRTFLCEVCGCRNLYFGRGYTSRILDGGLAEEEAPGPLFSAEFSRSLGGEQEERAGIPHINPSGLVDAASFAPPLAPGTLVSVFGRNLAPETRRADGSSWPLELAGVQLLINQRPVPVGSVSPGQIVAHLPGEVPRGAASFSVRCQGSLSPPRFALLTLTAPALFSADQTGRGRGLFHHAATGEPVTPDNPARCGEFVILYATGLGPVVPPVPAGQAAASEPLSRTTRRATVWMADRLAEIEFCGLTPGAVGLWQVKARVPRELPAGNPRVVLEIGGRRSNAVTLPVGR